MDEQQPQQPQAGQDWPSSVQTGSSLGGPQDAQQPAQQPAGTSNPTTGDGFVDNPNYKPSPSGFVDNPNYGKPQPDKELTVHDSDSGWTAAGKRILAAPEGIGETVEGIGAGALDTLGDIGQVGFKGASKAADLMGLPQQARDFLHHIADDQVAKEDSLPPAAKMGYGGETLAEFLMGDAALKALPVAKRLETAAKAIKTIEGSPRMVNALRIGARILALAGLHGAEAGTTQAAQTFIRANGSIEDKAKEAGKEGLETGLGATALGVPGEMLSEGLQKAGQVAGKVKNLSEVADNAKGKQEVVEEMGNRIKAANAQMHGDFETGIGDIKDRLKGQEIDPTDNPLQKKAKELLAKPNPEEHPFVVTAKNATGDKLDKSTKDLLEQLSTGTQPVEKGAEEVGPKGFLGLAQNAPKVDLAPETKPVKNLTIDDLVSLRQQVRALGDSYELGDINGRVLRKINNALDDTIGDMAQKSNDPTALSDYQNLRGQYRDKVKLFDDPVIKALRDGKTEDAARAFVGLKRAGSALPSAGKATYNTKVLKGVIGTDGVRAFGKDVFGTMLKDSVDNGQFNPAKFSEAWNRITDESKNDLFNISNAKNGLKQLAQDAHSGEQLQHLTRAGVLIPLGAAAGAAGLGPGVIHMGLGGLLGLTVAEGGGLAKGRELLNYVANHPEVWNTYEKVGKAAESGAIQTGANIMAKGATDAANRKPTPLKDALSQTSNALQ